MSRRSRRQAKKHLRNAQRDIFIPIARNPAAHILQLEDRRLFEPVDTFPRGQFRRSTRLVVDANVNKNKSAARKSVVPHKIKFDVPREVSLCVRRKQRREVLFALRKHGKGSARKRRRRTFFSNISCR